MQPPASQCGSSFMLVLTVRVAPLMETIGTVSLGCRRMETKELLVQCKRRLADRYGARLAGLVLYGSEARQESDEGSDIDLLVLLRPPFDFFEELRVVVDTLYPLQLETERHLSAKPAALDEFESGSIQLYRNAKGEGIAV